MKSIKFIWTLFIKVLGYLLVVLLTIAALVVFVWFPIKVKSYSPPTPTHLIEKENYLKSIPKVGKESPNVVIILFDDLGYGDLSCYGNPLIETPAMDSLAKNGVKMTHFYSSSPVCTPSRAGLLTGRLPIRTLAGDHVYFPEGHFVSKIRKVRGSVNELPKDEILLPEVLKAAGYSTGMIGKWHLGDRKGHLPNDFGFDEYYGVHFSNDMLPLHVFRKNEIEEEDKTKLVSGSGSYLDPDAPLVTKGVDQTKFTQNYTQEAINFIKSNKQDPFFLYFAHSFPHVPHFASSEHTGQSRGGLYGDVVEDLDRSVQAIIDALYENGLHENTLVIITSDNGGDYNGSAGGLRGRKQQSYEGGQRVPFIAWWGNHLPKGLETNEMAMNIDLYPTIASILNIPLPHDRVIEGKNILPALKGAASPHKYLFHTSAGSGKIMGIRNSRYKYHIGGYRTMPMFGMLGVVIKEKPQLNDILVGNESHNLIKKYPGLAETLRSSMNEKIADIESNKRGWLK